jgi:hypothetical protein
MPMLFLQTIETAITAGYRRMVVTRAGDASVSCWALQGINVGRPSWRHGVPYLLGTSLLKPIAGSSPD